MLSIGIFSEEINKKTFKNIDKMCCWEEYAEIETHTPSSDLSI